MAHLLPQKEEQAREQQQNPAAVPSSSSSLPPSLPVPSVLQSHAPKAVPGFLSTVPAGCLEIISESAGNTALRVWYKNLPRERSRER